MGKLTDSKIKALKPREKLYRVADGDGLCIEVPPSGKKRWRLRYRAHGKAKMVSLGTYPDVGLAEARERCRSARKRLAEGGDPKADESAREAATFKEVAEEYLQARKESISESHFRRTSNAFRNHCYPVIGSRPIAALTADDIMPIVHRIVDAGRYESAKKLFWMLGHLFKWAKSRRYVVSNPLAGEESKTIFADQVKGNYPAIVDPEGFAALMKAIEGYGGNVIVKNALKMTALTALRPANVRMMEWRWIDFDKALLTVPKERMKIRKTKLHEHDDFRVPLSAQALEVLREMQQISAGRVYVFPSPGSMAKPLSDAAMGVALKRTGITDHVPHGFRSSFSTIANDHGDFDPSIVEAALAHFGNGEVARVYNRGDLLEKRRRLMQWWGDWLDRIRDA